MSTTPDIADAWKHVVPAVNAHAEFVEIANDFGNPLELLREAISNAVDAKATQISIEFAVEEIDGAKMLVLTVKDNGLGMSEEVLARDFWGLGFSTSRGDDSKIGNKGHGTKIYLRSEAVYVTTQHASGSFEAVCERPMRHLKKGEPHKPSYRTIANFQEHTGTTIRILGYNSNERSSFTQDLVRDYIQWFTKFGSVERLFDQQQLEGTKILLKCLDASSFEEISFGHPFPPEDSDIEALFDKFGTSASERFVRRYFKKGERLKRFPEVEFDAVISIEGDQVKRDYNKQIRDRKRKDSGRYKVGDRYGLYLCRDFMPIQRVNEWISGFGTGSNSITLIHGFVNCQGLKLTANRGTIANTDPEVIAEIKSAVQSWIDEIDADLRTTGIYTLIDWQNEERTLAQEKADYTSRVEQAKKRRNISYKGLTLIEPRNEAELATLFTTIYSLHPDLFEFEPVDYSTARGIDVIAKNKAGGTGAESPFWYIELKYLLKPSLNHGFKHLRWIVCWDFEKDISKDTDFSSSVQDNDTRKLEIGKDADGKNLYYLNSKSAAVKVQVIRLGEFLKEHLGLEFK